MEPDLVSVVIPTRNRLGYLKEAVASVQAQTLSRWELVIVDDASEDETPSWLLSLSDPRIRVLLMDRNVHRAPARNRGLADASGEYITFLDDDDRLRPRALSVLARGLRRHPEAVAACGAVIHFDERGHQKRELHVRVPSTRAIWPEKLAGWQGGFTGQLMFPTELLRSVGGWNESLIALQDLELLYRVAPIGPIYLHPYAVQEKRKHAAQWSPTDISEAERRLKESFIASLADTDRYLAERAARMRREFQGAQRSLHDRKDFRAALEGFVAAYRSAPAVARSPIFRMLFLREFTNALVGRVFGRRGHALIAFARRKYKRILHRAPGELHTRKITPERTVHDGDTKQ